MRIDYDNQKIVWDRDDFTVGFSRSAQTNRLAGQSYRYNEPGAANMSNCDPFMPDTPGLLSIGGAPSAVSGTTASIPSNVLIDAALDLSGTNFYGVTTDQNVHKVSVSGGISWQSGHPIALGGVHVGHATASVFPSPASSCVIANRSGTLKLYYSWADNTDWDVGEFDLTSTFNDDFLSDGTVTNALAGSDLTDGVGKNHPLLYASDDRLLIGSSRYVHSYKCSTNTLNTKVLNMPIGMEVVGFVEKDYDTWVFATTAKGTGFRGRSAAYLWSIDRPASYYRTIPIPDDECSAPFLFSGMPGCFTRSRSVGGKSVLRLFDGVDWQPKYYFIGALPTVGGVDVQSNMVVFNSAGKIHRWGTYGNQWPEGGYQSTAGSGTTSGFVKSLSASDSIMGIVMSSGSGTSGGIETLLNYNTGSWVGMPAKPELGLRKKMKITAVQVSFVGGGSTQRTLQLDLLTEAFGAAITVFTGDTGHGGTDSVKTYLQEDFSVRDDTLTAVVAPSFTWSAGTGNGSAPSIQQVEVYYEMQDYIQ